MSQHKQPSNADSGVITEAELFGKWDKHPSPFVQSILQDRRERLERGERLPSKQDLEADVRRARYGDDDV